MTGKKPPSSNSSRETKVFRSGNSDAVRIPAGLLHAGMRVTVTETDEGGILIEPVKKREWPPGFFESLGRLSEDFEIPPDPPISPEDDERDAHLFDWVDDPKP